MQYYGNNIYIYIYYSPNKVETIYFRMPNTAFRYQGQFSRLIQCR